MNSQKLINDHLHLKGNIKGRIDGLSKTRGEARYVDDIHLEEMAYAKVVRSPYPSARIKSIDTSEAKQLDGVLAVVTGEDLSTYSTYGRLVYDIPVMAKDVVQFVGDRVAAVVAESPDIAEEAIGLIHVEYEPLDAVLDARTALSENAPTVHDKPWAFPNAVVTEKDHPNLQSRYILGNAEGDEIEKTLAKSTYVFEGEFEVPIRHQGYLETQVSIANVTQESIQVWTTNKNPYALRLQLADWLDCEINLLDIQPLMIGGDFGGKGAPMEVPLCICLSRIVGRPVKLRMSYAEDLIAANPGHDAFVKVRLGVDKDYRMTGLYLDVLFDGGAFAGFKPVDGAILLGSKEGGNNYKIDKAYIESQIVYTNTVPRGHIRAPGGVATAFAVESIIDMAAQQLQIDPIEFRRLNVLKTGEANFEGITFLENRGQETLDLALEEYKKLNEPIPPAEGNWAYGTGVALYSREAHGGETEVALEPHSDGSITAWVGFPEQGGGQLSMVHNVVREALGLPAEHIHVKQAVGEQLSFDTGVGGSRVTIIASDALTEASTELLRTLKAEYDLPEEYNSEQLIQAISRMATATNGQWIKASWDPNKLGYITSYCAQIARVRVDKDTGEVIVEDLITVADVANIINPSSHQVQIEGGIIHGYGDAMLADLGMSEGRITAANLGEYKLPSVRDVPTNLIVRLLKGGKGLGKLNVKPIGELTSAAVGPAIANAIDNAVGVRLTSFPLKAEKVFAALQQQKA